MGEIYRKQKRWKDVVLHYRDFLKRWGKHATDDRVLQAHTYIGLAAEKLGRTKDAVQAFARAVKVFNGLPDGKRKKLMDGREAAAHARFKQGEALFDKFRSFKVNNAKKIAKQVTEKLKGLVAAKEVYDSVISYGHPNWAIAAIGRNGAGFQELASAVRNAPAPKGLNEEELMVYEDELDQQASQFDVRAAENYVTVLQLAAKSQWFNKWTVLAETELQSLRPGEYTLAGELRSDPHFASEGFRSSPFDTTRLTP